MTPPSLPVLPHPPQAYSAVLTSKEKTSPRVPAAALPSSLSSSIALSNLPLLQSVRSSPARGRALSLPARPPPPPRAAWGRIRRREDYRSCGCLLFLLGYSCWSLPRLCRGPLDSLHPANLKIELPSVRSVVGEPCSPSLYWAAGGYRRALYYRGHPGEARQGLRAVPSARPQL